MSEWKIDFTFWLNFAFSPNFGLSKRLMQKFKLPIDLCCWVVALGKLAPCHMALSQSKHTCIAPSVTRESQILCGSEVLVCLAAPANCSVLYWMWSLSCQWVVHDLSHYLIMVCFCMLLCHHQQIRVSHWSMMWTVCWLTSNCSSTMIWPTCWWSFKAKWMISASHVKRRKTSCWKTWQQI